MEILSIRDISTDKKEPIKFWNHPRVESSLWIWTPDLDWIHLWRGLHSLNVLVQIALAACLINSLALLVNP